MKPGEQRRAHAVDALGTALTRAGVSLDQRQCENAVDAVLAAIHPYTEHCTHYVIAHRAHHDRPVAGCPWCAAEPQTVPTGDLL